MLEFDKVNWDEGIKETCFGQIQFQLKSGENNGRWGEIKVKSFRQIQFQFQLSLAAIIIIIIIVIVMSSTSP